MSKTKIWYCKIGEVFEGELGSMPDLRMRAAVREAYIKLTSRPPIFLFSGWGGELTQSERDVVNDV